MIIRALTRLLFVAYFLEVGLVLIVVPWSAFWDRNYFVEAMPSLQELFRNNFVRGAVSGLGLLNVWAGLVDLAAIVSSRQPGPASAGYARMPMPGGRGPSGGTLDARE